MIRNRNMVFKTANDDSVNADKYLTLPQISKTSLPTASSDNEGGLSYDASNDEVRFSDGSNWEALSKYIEVSFHGQAAAEMVDQSFFIANRTYQVVAVKYVHAVAESTATTLKVQVVKDHGTDAPGAGDNLLTNNSNAGFDCKATANTVQSGTLTSTTANLQLAAGDRLSVDFTDSATELVGATITVTLKKI